MRRLALLINSSYALLLVVLALAPRLPAVSGLGVSDFMAHATAYGVQAGLLFWLFELFPSGSAALRAMSGASGFGVLTEILQLLSPIRHFEFVDMAADILGALIVVFLLFGLRSLQKVRTA